eukprot:2070580-Pleurochrysis_carterae.AAC.4
MNNARARTLTAIAKADASSGTHLDQAAFEPRCHRTGTRSQAQNSVTTPCEAQRWRTRQRKPARTATDLRRETDTQTQRHRLERHGSTTNETSATRGKRARSCAMQPMSDARVCTYGRTTARAAHR